MSLGSISVTQAQEAPESEGWNLNAIIPVTVTNEEPGWGTQTLDYSLSALIEVDRIDGTISGSGPTGRTGDLGSLKGTVTGDLVLFTLHISKPGGPPISGKWGLLEQADLQFTGVITGNTIEGKILLGSFTYQYWCLVRETWLTETQSWPETPFTGCIIKPVPTYYTITATAGNGGTIAPEGQVIVEQGASQTFTITPNEGYSVVDVLVDGVSVGRVTTYTFTNVTADHTIHATFNQPPVASFTYSPTNPVVGQGITFDASSSYDQDGTIVKYEWDFGDGDSGEGMQLAHTYTSTGTYKVTLTVTDNSGLINSIQKDIEVKAAPIASFTYSPENPFICGGKTLITEKIIFDASSSYDPDGTIVKYEWDFGDGNTEEGEVVTHTYTEAGKYKVILTVKDNDGLTSTTEEFVSVDLIPGDLLLGFGTKVVPGFWSHVGMYIGKGEVVESHVKLGGVKITSLNYWCERYKTWAALRVSTANREIREKAIQWATDPARLDDPYDLMWWQKDRNGEAWYCSELVWAAYLHASNEQINIEYHRLWEILEGGITIDEILLDEETNIIAEHYDQTPRKGFVITTKSPVDLEVVDPESLSVSKHLFAIPEAIYGEDDIDGDGDLEDWIGIPERKNGEYLISVIPEPDASLTDTYTLEVLLEDDTTVILAENVRISDIPSQPYVFVSMGIIPSILNATVRIEPETLNLASQGVFTAFITLPEGYDVANIDISTVVCEGAPAVKGMVSEEDSGTYIAKFNVQDLVDVPTGDAVTLKVTGKVHYNDGLASFEGNGTIGVINQGKGKPAPALLTFSLGQNFRNPFNPDTWIPYTLAKDVNVVIRIYSSSGQPVRTLNLGHQQAGRYVIKSKAAYWDGKNEAGERVASGVYFYQLQAGKFTATKKMFIAK